MKRAILIGLSSSLGIMLLASQSGCLVAAAAAGTGATVAYVRGDNESVINGNAHDVTNAVERAMKGLEIAVISKEASQLDGRVVGRTARDVKMTVIVKGESAGVSHVSIRAGVFGDSTMQNQLLERIHKEIESPTPATATAN